VTEEMMRDASRLEPRPGVYAAVRGNELKDLGSLQKFSADAAGHFSADLPPGHWCIVDASKLSSLDAPLPASRASDLDVECLERQRRACDATVDVGEHQTQPLEIHFWAGCPEVFNQPCYRGPMPP
jgi:hypothetical protein